MPCQCIKARVRYEKQKILKRCVSNSKSSKNQFKPRNSHFFHLVAEFISVGEARIGDIKVIFFAKLAVRIIFVVVIERIVVVKVLVIRLFGIDLSVTKVAIVAVVF